MDEREKKIAEAAARVFSRYGVKRTTMNDIAEEAGVVRQTLYNAFANKEDVLRAVIRFFADQGLAEIAARTADVPDLAGRLDIVFEVLALRPFDIMARTPHAEDIVEGVKNFARDEMESSNRRYQAMMEGILAPCGEDLARSGLDARRLARFLRQALTSFKHKAESREDLVDLLGTMKALVLGAATGRTPQIRLEASA